MRAQNGLSALTLTLFATLLAKTVAAQATVSVDLLDPSETQQPIPVNTKIVDVFVDVATTDVWYGAGINVRTRGGAWLSYYEDPNGPSVPQPLTNPGLEGRFTTTISKPRNRGDNQRFTNCGAAVAGAYPTPAPIAIVTPNELGVVYYANPPEGPDSPSVDGYIARIAVDVSTVPGAADHPDNADWGLGDMGTAPPGATIVFESGPQIGAGYIGTAIVARDDLNLTGINWQLWFVPEPSSIVLLIWGGLAVHRLHRVERSKRS